MSREQGISLQGYNFGIETSANGTLVMVYNMSTAPRIALVTCLAKALVGRRIPPSGVFLGLLVDAAVLTVVLIVNSVPLAQSRESGEAGPVTVTASAKMFLLQTPNVVCFWRAPVAGSACRAWLNVDTAIKLIP